MSANDRTPSRFPDPIDRARQVSLALSEAARRARFSTRTRANYSGGGFSARRGAGAIRFAMIASFLFLVVIPGAAGIAYYMLIASDQYVAEAKFTVIGNDIPQLDSIGSLTGLAAASVVQDTQIVTNYIASRAAIEAISRQVDLREAYSRKEIDYLSRFDSSKSIEKMVRYWQSMVTTAILLPAGIVELKIRAFSPEEALTIANAVIRSSEVLINDMNNREHEDAMRTANAQLARATARLTAARIAVEKARNDEGILDATKAGDAINALISESRTSLLDMQQEYATQIKLVSPKAPQLKVLKERIDATIKQISEMESKLTASRESLGSNLTVAASMSRFAELDLERQIAERLYAGAIASLEVSRLASEQRKIYLNAFVRPSLPQEPQFPRRELYSALLVLGLLTAWGIAWGLITLIRNHMA